MIEAGPIAAAPARLSDYLELTKPRLSLLSVLTALAGYETARTPHEPARLLWLLVGASLAAGGVAALNQWMEVDTDAQMHRTAQRPIPAGKVATGSAFVLGGLMCVASLMLLFGKVNQLSALFTLLTIFAYLGWYTPAKPRSRWSTEIGAVAGALPPLIGWSAGEDRVSALGWILFGILFFWQIPHFMAIAWTYRRDYSAVHFPMPSVTDPSGRLGRRLVLRQLLPPGDCEPAAGLAAPGHLLVRRRRRRQLRLVADRAAQFLHADGRDLAARRLFFATIAYLPLVLLALVADRMIFF